MRRGLARRAHVLALLAGLLLPACQAEQRDEARDAILEEQKLYSHGAEELIIRHFFNDRRGGFFVDVGAFHWENNSNTNYLEKHLDWSGIAIDALPFLAHGWQKFRPRTKFYNYIVTDHSGTVETLYAAGALSSIKEEHLDLFPGAEEKRERGAPESYEVATITLNELLEGVEKIELLSMDIEEAEPEALAGFDIERFQPELVCIEAMVTVRDKIKAYFEAHGYERIDAYLKLDATNWYYRPRPQ
jgi:FkbM family methyltransferase